jgi:multiple sugar transport system ATP-binding protein
MAEELRALHDRIGATTVYVTHDQLEAMQMGDKIVVMNHGVVEQFGKPQEIYDWPATKFVAKFIGSPAMNFFDFEGAIDIGDDVIELSGQRVRVPSSRQGANGKLAMGIRPEHIRFSDASNYRGRVLATEYLGTTQIITLSTPNGEVKARASSRQDVRVGETIGLEFDASTVTIFEGINSRALLSEANEGVLRHG